jgi:hypothetical protein
MIGIEFYLKIVIVADIKAQDKIQSIIKEKIYILEVKI